MSAIGIKISVKVTKDIVTIRKIVRVVFSTIVQDLFELLEF